MSTILVLCVIAAAGWLALSLVARPARRASGDSVADFHRALSAMSGPAPRRAPARARSRPRPPARPARARR